MKFTIYKDSNVETLLSRVHHYAHTKGANDKVVVELVTICSEIIYNIVKYANEGWLELASDHRGFLITAKDSGQGFADCFELACSDGYSTGGSLGLGIPSIIRMSDELHISTCATGTEMTSRKDF